MARQRKLSPERKAFINSLLEHYQPTDAIVKKNQTDIFNIEDQARSMYAKGMTTRDISAHLRSVYGVDASAEMISHMTDRISGAKIPLIRSLMEK